jgi:hypothetical protein
MPPLNPKSHIFWYTILIHHGFGIIVQNIFGNMNYFEVGQITKELKEKMDG